MKLKRSGEKATAEASKEVDVFISAEEAEQNGSGKNIIGWIKIGSEACGSEEGGEKGDEKEIECFKLER